MVDAAIAQENGGPESSSSLLKVTQLALVVGSTAYHVDPGSLTPEPTL